MSFGHFARIPMLLFALSCTLPTAAFDWPLSRFRMNSTFGTPRDNYFQFGIHFFATEASVFSIARGEVVFFQKDKNPSGGMPTPLGNLIAVEHSEGLESIYSNLGSLSDAVTRSTKEIAARTLLGTAGKSGIAPFPGLFLGVFDTKTAQWVNPLLVLPSRSDGMAPAILSMALTNDGHESILGKVAEIAQGSYTISAEVKDMSGSPEAFSQSAPFEIQLMVDGKDVAKKVFDLLWWKDGQRKLFTPGMVSRKGFLDRNGRYRLIDIFLPRGKTTIGIIVSDAGGDRRKAEWTLQVK
jgi:hypothetical protein